jgi:hypothetical protein
MLRDLDPPMDDTTRLRLGRLIDAIETGPPPSLDDLEQGGTHLQIVGDNQPAAPRDRRRRALVVTGIAAALALVVGAALVLRDGDDDTDVSNDPDDVPRLVVDPEAVPSGVDITTHYAADLPLGADEVDPGITTVTVYGDPAADDPVARGDLAVIVVEDETMGMDGEPTTVRGHEGRSSSSSEFNDIGLADQPSGISCLLWDETDDLEITLASRTFDLATLRAIAAGLVVEGRRVRLGELPGDLPGPLEPVGSLPDMPFTGSPYAPGSAVGHLVMQGNVEGSWVQVGTFAGDQRTMAAVRWMARATQPVEVRGREGWTGESSLDTGGTTSVVVWQEAPGVVAIVQAAGMSPDETLHTAETLRTASAAEWDELLPDQPTG